MSEDRNTLLTLAEGLRSIMGTNPPFLRGAIESYLEAETKHLSASERLAVLDNLMFLFSPAGDEGGIGQPSTSTDAKGDRGDGGPAEPPQPKDQQSRPTEDALHDPGFARLVSLILGRKVAVTDLSPTELSEKLVQAMNTIFDTLNDIVEMIQINLLGQKAEQETIRQIIGSQMGSGPTDNSLQNYLDQIREAFLVAHKAFRTAAVAVTQDLLFEMDPEKIAAASEGKLKFGPLRKAELFDLYKEKFGICKGWLESGRVLEGFLREFEKACQKIYKK
jgi:hypothetical protein